MMQVHTNETGNACFAKLQGIGKFGHTEDNALAQCFAEIVSELHIHHDIRKICEALPYDTSNFDEVDFINAMANLGYESKVIDTRLNQVDKRLYPCLFIPDDKESSPKIILGAESDSANSAITVFDGASARRVDVIKGKKMPGKAYLFRHYSLKEQKTQRSLRKSIGHGWFRVCLERFRAVFMQIFAVSVVLNIVSLASAVFIMMVYDHVVAARSLDKLGMLAVGVAIAIVVEWALRSLRSKSLSWFSGRLDYIVSNAIFGNLLHLPASLIEHGSIASQVARIKAFESVRDFFTGPLFLVMVELPFTLVILGAIALISGWLAVIPLGVGAFMLLLLFVVRPRLRLAIHESARSSSDKQQSYIETFEKLHSLKTNGMHEVWNDQFRDISGKSSLVAFRSHMLSSAVDTISHALVIFAGVLVIYFGVEDVMARSISAGALVATLILVWRVLSPLQILCGALPRLEQLKQSVDQINRLMDIGTEQVDEKNAKELSIKGEISFNKVGLRYNKDNDPVFAGLSFDIKQGQLVTLAGANGTGKSTILKLINGLYRPQAGTIRIDGTDVRQLDPIALRKQIAYVSQAPEFFEGTIAENLRFAEPLATDEDIKRVLQQVDALSEIEELPEGLNTFVGSGLSNQLPTSLNYRLNLARAYLKDSKILLLDELPYELLASKTGDAFKRMLITWRNTKTMIVVTHRDDFVAMSDFAIFLRGTESAVVGEPTKILNVMKYMR